MADVQLSSAIGPATTGAAAGPSSRASAAPAAATPLAGAPSDAAPSGAAASANLAGTGNAAKPADPSMNKDQIKSAVKKANEVLTGINTQLVFVFDDQGHGLAVKLLDIQTQKVVQQIPPAAMSATANALADSTTSGTLVDEKA